MNILALDLATKCGWCVTPRTSGVWVLANKNRHASEGIRYITFEKRLRTAIKGLRVEFIAYEEVRHHTSTGASHVYGGLQAILLKVAEELGINYQSIPVSQIKKHATGRGNANKDAMVAAAEEKWPAIRIEDDNHADALWIWDLAQKEFGDE